MGKVFWAGALVAICERDAREVELALHDLARKELVRSSRTSSMRASWNMRSGMASCETCVTHRSLGRAGWSDIEPLPRGSRGRPGSGLTTSPTCSHITTLKPSSWRGRPGWMMTPPFSLRLLRAAISLWLENAPSRSMSEAR